MPDLKKENILRVTRTKETYRSKISSQSKGSQRGIFLSIANFENFCMQEYGIVNIVPMLLELEEIERFHPLQLWINHMNEAPTKRTGKPLDPTTVKMYFSRVKVYLHYMGVKLDAQDIKLELTFRRVPEEEKYGLTLDNINRILDGIYFPMKVQLMCQLSSLMRVGEMVQLRKRHLITDKENIVVKISSDIAKLKKARTTFFSKEASAMIRPKLKTLSANDLVFGTNENVYYAEQNSGKILRLHLEKIGLDMKNSKGNNMINTHSFRAFGITKITDHDEPFAKKLAGQKMYLDTYVRKSPDDLFKKYLEFEHELTIDQTKKDKLKIDQLEADAQVKMKAMAERLADLEDIMSEKEKRRSEE